MLTLPRMAAIAAGLAITILPVAAHARGGGGHSGMGGPMHGRMGAGTPHTLTPAASTSGAMMRPVAAPASKQTGTQTPPSQPQNPGAAAASSTSTGQNTSINTTSPPPSAIAAPAPEQPAIAPLSPAPAQIIESSGGSSGVNTTTTSSSTSSTSGSSPVASTASPSESAPSTPGGGGDTLAACMAFWDAGTHMTKAEWHTACTRTLNRIDLKAPLPLSTPQQQHAGALHHHRHAAR